MTMNCDSHYSDVNFAESQSFTYQMFDLKFKMLGFFIHLTAVDQTNNENIVLCFRYVDLLRVEFKSEDYVDSQSSISIKQ